MNLRMVAKVDPRSPMDKLIRKKYMGVWRCALRATEVMMRRFTTSTAMYIVKTMGWGVQVEKIFCLFSIEVILNTVLKIFT